MPVRPSDRTNLESGRLPLKDGPDLTSALEELSIGKSLVFTPVNNVHSLKRTVDAPAGSVRLIDSNPTNGLRCDGSRAMGVGGSFVQPVEQCST